MTFFVSSKKNDSECVSIVDSQGKSSDRGSPIDAIMEGDERGSSSQTHCEDHFRDDEDENLTQASSSDKDIWTSEHEDIYEESNERRSKTNRRALIVEEPESSFESIDSSTWPRSLSGRSLNKTGEYNRLRWCKVIVPVTLMIVLSSILGVFVSYKKKATTSQSENLRASSVVTQSPPTNNIFDEEETDEENMNNVTIIANDAELDGNATESFDDLATDVATEAAGSCMDMIRTDQRCYTRKDLRNDALTIGFVRCEPHRENWVGIYDAGLTAAELPEPLLWLWTCDSQDMLDCNDVGVVSGALVVSGMLESGFYQAHLVERDGNAPYSAFLSSEVFEVNNDCAM